MEKLHRSSIFPENRLPDGGKILQDGKLLAASVIPGISSFLDEYKTTSEYEYKKLATRQGRIMQHAQIGFRTLDRTLDAARNIHAQVADAGFRVDRYGICLDWSMGYPKAARAGRPKGTGLILDNEAAFAELANAAPVAPHFGDFVIGMPAAIENTIAAIRAGSTAIGNLGQYFTFELPGWQDDIETTRVTVQAIAMAAAQPVPILIHSNIDDGFAARFTDLASALGAILLETYIVDELIGGKVSHCYGHTFSKAPSRFAFQRALLKVSKTPGTMVYGNTTAYRPDEAASYAALAAYLSTDILAQKTEGSGHAINPVPVTEAIRIPDIDEIVSAQVFCGTLIKNMAGAEQLVSTVEADILAERIVEGGYLFRQRVLDGLGQAGINVQDPFELLLAIRRVGAKRLEQLFGPGKQEPAGPNGRRPVEPSPVLEEVAQRASLALARIPENLKRQIADGKLCVVTATTDVHEYGKRLLDQTLLSLDVSLQDGGVSTDPDRLVEIAANSNASAIFISTYNGVALDFLKLIQAELDKRNIHIPIFVGGKLNQVADGSNSNLPTDVGDQLSELGAVVCREVEDFYVPLAALCNHPAKEEA